jgi:hypothetical protein
MYTRWFLAILALIGATLACSFPGMDDDPNLSVPHVVDNPKLIRNADITLDLSNATSDASSMTPGWGCWPPTHNKEGSDSDITGSFTVSPPSSTSHLEGKCSSSNGATATLDGSINWSTETIEFTMVVTSNSQLNISETFYGNGSFVSQTRAEGNAKWSMTCAEKGNGYVCAAEKASGTVPWTMTFSP